MGNSLDTRLSPQLLSLIFSQDDAFFVQKSFLKCLEFEIVIYMAIIRDNVESIAPHIKQQIETILM